MSGGHWHILGAGAIGCLAAEALAGAGCETTILLRAGTATQDTQTKQRLRVERGDTCSEQVVAVEPSGSQGKIARLLITTKAYDVLEAVQAIEHRLSSDSEIVLLVNGMGIAEQLRTKLPISPIYLGTTTEGAYRKSPLHICHAGRGETRIGVLQTPGSSTAEQPTPPRWFPIWQASSLLCTWDPTIETALWSKLAVNCVINPLTAVHRCRNGELAENSTLAAEADTLCREVMQVSYAAGFTRIAQDLRDIVAKVIAGTAGNRSSMLEDVERARPTEIDYITGYLLNVADRHGIVAPHNRALYERVKNFV